MFYMNCTVFSRHLIVFSYSIKRMVSDAILFLLIRCFRKFSVLRRKLRKGASEMELFSGKLPYGSTAGPNHMLL